MKHKMSDEKKVEILYDHYKDTFENQKVYLQKRNNYTLICLGLITTLSFQILNPDQSNSNSMELIKKYIGDIEIEYSYIKNILTFALLWVVIMYYQINFLVEKLYKYIHEIEMSLTNEMNPFEIKREGKTYLGDYPWLLEVVDKIYSIGFPVTLIIVSIIKWTTEKNQIKEPFNGHFWFDTILLFFIILTSLLYIINRHFNDFRKKKK